MIKNKENKWNTTHIGEIAEVKGGKRLPKSKLVGDEETNHPYIRVVDFAADGVNSANLKYIDDETHSAISRYTISENDVYISIAGTIGRVGIVPTNLSGANLTENAAKICDIDSSMDKRFLMYFLRSRVGQSYIKSQIVGTSQPKLALFRIKEIEVPRPPLSTQHEIASILSAYDDLIENNTRRIRILEEMAQSLYREWFVHFRFPGHEKVKLVSSSLGQIPEGWEVAPVSDLFEIIGGGTPSKKVEEFWTKGEINWFVPSDLTASKTMFMEQSKKRITELGLRKSSARLFPANSVMLTSRATIGVVAMNTETACTNQGFITCIPNETVLTFFLYHWLLENKDTFLSLASGATFKEISKGVFRTIDFLLPAKAIVNQFEEFIRPVGEQILNLQRRNANLRYIRDLLLPKLITGVVDVSNVLEDVI